MALIPVGTNYHVDMQGTAYKHVQCEECGRDYYYRMTRDALGGATSWLFLNQEGAQAAAVRKAKEKVEEQLSQESDPIPCPHCGRFQEHMLPYARREYLPWMRGAGRLLALFACPLLLVSCITTRGNNIIFTNPFGAAGAAVLAVGLGLIGLRIALSQRFDANQIDQQRRIDYGRRKCVPKEEFEKMTAAGNASQAATDEDEL
jgi:hypothetical protein